MLSVKNNSWDLISFQLRAPEGMGSHLQLSKPRITKATGELGPWRHSDPSPLPQGPLTAAPPGLQREESTLSLQVIQDCVARAERGHNVGRLDAGEGH